MAVDARIRELGARHESLEEAIRREMARPGSDSLQLREMKRQKLRLKEQMEHLRQHAM
jgi:hypothetical protein